MNRLYTNEVLLIGKILELRDQYHYLKSVLRLKIGDNIRIFNNIDGEFLAQITNTEKNVILIRIINCIRKALNNQMRLILGLCIIKPDRMLRAIDMAVQLGITEIIPIISERSQLQNVNYQRIKKCIIASVEQSEQFNLPNLHQATKISKIDYSEYNTIIIANEHETKCANINLQNDILLLVGPEGGFTDTEINDLLSFNNAYSISLSTNILRSETAVAAAISQMHLLFKIL